MVHRLTVMNQSMYSIYSRAWNIVTFLFLRVQFELSDDDENILLNVFVFKHMDSSLVDVDVQSNYVRVTLKGKILQLCLQESVKSELSSAQRSQTTGQLLIKMPKVYKIFQKLLTYIQITQLF